VAYFCFSSTFSPATLLMILASGLSRIALVFLRAFAASFWIASAALIACSFKAFLSFSSILFTYSTTFSTAFAATGAASF
jgi:hypothetical protein